MKKTIKELKEERAALAAKMSQMLDVAEEREAKGFTFPNHNPRFAADPEALPLAAALKAGGIPALEVTVRSEAAYDAIDAIQRKKE